jgi:hypothetical protein
VSRTLSAKPHVKSALKTPSSSLASMSKRRMSRTDRNFGEFVVGESLATALGASDVPAAPMDGLGPREGEMSASSGSHPRSRLNVLQKKQARLAQRHCRWMAHLGPSVRSRDPLATADGGE